MVTVTCPVCLTPFEVWPARLRKVTEPKCSRQCNGVLRGAEWATHGHKGATARKRKPDMRGAKNPAWKGGVTYWRKKGNYPSIKYVRAPAWALPMARKDGYVMEHRLLMAQMVGRLLTRAECVHHRDHDPLNNARPNLELWPTNADHKRGEAGRFVPGVACRLASGLL